MYEYLLSGYDFTLPERLIAQWRVPLDRERLLSVDKKGAITDQYFLDMIDGLDSNTVFVLNNTKVVQARIILHNVTCINPAWVSVLLASGEIFVYEVLDDLHAEVLVSDGKHFRPWWKVVLDATDNVVLSSEKFATDGIVMKVSWPLNWRQIMETFGEVPLPPYVEKNISAEDNTQEYQTDFAQEDGSVAAPTASLRFTQDVLKRLDNKWVDYGFVTLHVGLGTFKPLYKDDVRDHDLHREAVSVSQEFLQQLNQWKVDGKKIVGVGTTVCRVLESLPYLTDYVTGPTKFLLSGIAWSKKDDHEWISNVSYNPQGLCFFTKMFIYPGFSPYVIDWLITNFHLPKTSLLVLVATLLGWQEMLLEVYMHAIEKKYRFYSFGDGMMVLNK